MEDEESGSIECGEDKIGKEKDRREWGPTADEPNSFTVSQARHSLSYVLLLIKKKD